jgi:hypothetical protein
MSDSKMRRAIHGRNDRDNNPGLLGKCHALTFVKGNTTISSDDGRSRSTQQNEYALDERAYIACKSHGDISLIPEILEKSLLTHIAHAFPTFYPHLGKAITGTYGASFPNLTNIIINNNYNNNTLPKGKGEREDAQNDGVKPAQEDTGTPSPPPALSLPEIGQSDPGTTKKRPQETAKAETEINKPLPPEWKSGEMCGNVGKADTHPPEVQS